MNRHAAALTGAALAAAAALLLLGACGNGGPADDQAQPTGTPPPALPTVTAGPSRTPAPGEIVLSSDALSELGTLAFTSEVRMVVGMATGDVDQELRFEGVFQPPDRIQGELHASGKGWETSGLPTEMDLIYAESQAWWREAGSSWQMQGTPGEPGILAVFSMLGTPVFYLHEYGFNSILLPATGPGEEVNGVDSWAVELDKAALLRIAGETAFTDSYGGAVLVDPEALDKLPEDLLVQAWIAKDGLYPVRVAVSLQGEQGDEVPFLVFHMPAEVHVQIDILGPATETEIEPPTVSGE